MTTFVLAKDGTRLMPTTNVKKVRKLLRSGRARIYRREPFTIQLKYESGHGTQPIELTEDTGYQTIGLSVKSEKHEYVSAEYTLLADEKDRHDKRRKYRRDRRNRLRYRKPRFDNRKKEEGWLPPSTKNKAHRHIMLAEAYMEVCPVTSIVLEMGQFDTQALEAVEEGKPLPEGDDYQHGARYGFDTLREAVFVRDNYKCVCCGASGIPQGGKPGAILRVHHLGFKDHDHSNRMGNLVTVCTKCHTPADHKPGGKLYDLKPRLSNKSGAAFINTVRWYIYNALKEAYPGMVHMTYGVTTKRVRHERNIAKSHANDAYCIGEHHPKHRTHTREYRKARRHNRVLSKFYDAVYIDTRDGTKKKGAELPSGRVSRNHDLDGENLRKYRGEKVRKGRTVLRTKTYDFSPGDVVQYKNETFIVEGMNRNGEGVVLKRKDKMVNPSPRNVMRVRRSNGWKELIA